MLHAIWYKNHPLKWVFWPLSVIFELVTLIRRALYKHGFKKSIHPGVPVIVVGNISVGGNGKTPVVIALVEELLAHGYQPGVLSRGYGGKCAQFPHCVTSQDEAAWVGDEPKLMASRLNCAVVIDPKRSRGAARLVELNCDVIICDDGLQHYALKRDIEYVVMDDRGLGNNKLMPMGPLREKAARLNSVDAIIHNGKTPLYDHAYVMSLLPAEFRQVANPKNALSIEDFKKQYRVGCSAIAGIGDPQRYFSTLKDLGFELSETIAFADHYQYAVQDIPKGPTLMTEKDAVKCVGFAHPECWYLAVQAKLPETFIQSLHAKLLRVRCN